MDLNGVIVKDQNSYLAFIKSQPCVMAQGKSIDDVKIKLNEALEAYIIQLNNSKGSIYYSEPLEVGY